MVITLESEDRIRLGAEGDGLAFEVGGEHVHLSPFHLLAASLATCTYSVLLSWSEQAKLDVDGLEITVDWDLGGDPYRVTDARMVLVWPALPEERREAARRVAAQCTVHRTLEGTTHVDTRVAPSGDGGRGRQGDEGTSPAP